MTPLPVFLRDQARLAFAWGVTDCLLLGADWCRALGLPDPAEPWRGAYADQAGADALLARHGGVEGLMREGLARIGAEATNRVRPGDLAAVRVLGPDGPTLACGIATGRRFALRAPRGLWIGRAEPVAAWSLPLIGEVR